MAGDFVPTGETHKNSIQSYNCIDIIESSELNFKGKQKKGRGGFYHPNQKYITHF